jgi:hypothetical protein
MGCNEHSLIRLALIVHHADRLVEVEARAAAMDALPHHSVPMLPLPFRPGCGGRSPSCPPHVVPARCGGRGGPVAHHDGGGGRDTERKDRDRTAAVETALLSEKMSTRDLRHFLITRASGVGYP